MHPLSYWILRVGFGLSYLYSGSNMFFVPRHWYGYMPQWFSRTIIDVGFTVDQFLKLQGAVEMAMGVLFLAWFINGQTRWNSVLHIVYMGVAVQMLLILLLSGIDPNTFRDIVLLAAAVALLLMSRKESESLKA